jgi:hypothetical protein
MLIYLDTMIVQYVADYQEFILQGIVSECEVTNLVNEPKLATELEALRRLAFLEQFGHWDFAVSTHLIDELHAGKPTPSQHETYTILSQAWEDSIWNENTAVDEEKVLSIEHLFMCLNLKDKADRRHLAEAIVLGASWFLTNDANIIKRVQQRQEELKSLTDEIVPDDPQLTTNQRLNTLLELTIVAKPSECITRLEKQVLRRLVG